jgi:hypothetical protein
MSIISVCNSFSVLFGTSAISARRDAKIPLEDFAKGGLGSVSHPFCCFGYCTILVSQIPCRLVHPPTGQVLKRRITDNLFESCCERRTGHSNGFRKRIDSPRLFRTAVHISQGSTDLMVLQTRQPTTTVFRQAGNVQTNYLNEQDIRKACNYCL